MAQSSRMPTSARSGVVRSITTIGLLIGCAPAHAEDLKDALTAAYQASPTLEGQRARVRAVDENVSIANSGYRPRVTAGGSLTWEHTIIGGGGDTGVTPTGTLTTGGTNRQAAYGVTVNQPLFTGLQVTSQARVAEADVRAAREALRDTERTVLLRAVAAFAGAVASRSTVQIQEQNLERMTKQVRVVKERVALTELTNTDLSQAELRRDTAKSLVADARAALKTARAAYLEVIGHEPGKLSEPGLPGGLPKSLNEALAIAGQENPLIISALYGEEAARHTVDRIRGQLLPQLSITASWGDQYNTNAVPYQNTAVVQGNLTVPLYEGGQVQAEVRQAKQIHLSQIQAIEAVRSFVQRTVTASWSQLEAVRTRVSLGQSQIRNAQVALDGVLKEETIGQRTILDVLNAEQDLLTAKVAMIDSKRDLVVASYDLLAQIGRLESERLGLTTLVYDPVIHYEEVRRKWFGISITYADGHSEDYHARDRDERTSLK